MAEDRSEISEFVGDRVSTYQGVKDVNIPMTMETYKEDLLDKDLFVEVISENDLKLSRGAKDKIVQVFDDAPVSNPDGSEGIDIHIDDDTPGYSLEGENPDLEKYEEGA
ncbi:MAG: hypothetical protein ABEJ72_04785, partial [Candidatus Aenigmatarchaeota archaeon]